MFEGTSEQYENLRLRNLKRDHNERIKKLVDDLQYVLDNSLGRDVRVLVQDVIGRVEDLKL